MLDIAPTSLELTDHALLAGGVHDLVAENAAAASRLARMLEFHRRRATASDQPPIRFFTPAQETVVEAGALWSVSPGRIRSELQRGRVLAAYFPGVWSLCLAGRLDLYRAGLIADATVGTLPESQWAALAERLTPWLRGKLRRPGGDPDLPELVCCTPKQLRNKLTYESTRLRPRDADERFRAAYDERRVTARTHPVDGSVGDGTGSLHLTHGVDAVQLADHRLTMAAQAVRAQGDERTLEQLRADLALDLIIGRALIPADNAELERIGEEGGEGEPVVVPLPTGAFARPVINVTVPIQTLMGVSDDPGTLSGGTTLPATLARMIASTPGSTWHRMLTDPAGRCREVSTTSYRPTKPIWNEVVARFETCFRAGCDRPASQCELDHQVPWPVGPTSVDNLQPACAGDHHVKHAPGFGLATSELGEASLTTRAGFDHPVQQPAKPSGHCLLPEDLFGFQYSATEIVDALTHLAALRHSARASWSTLDDLWADAG